MKNTILLFTLVITGEFLNAQETDVTVISFRQFIEEFKYSINENPDLCFRFLGERPEFAEFEEKKFELLTHI
jgi:hypothetical protein